MPSAQSLGFPPRGRVSELYASRELSNSSSKSQESLPACRVETRGADVEHEDENLRERCVEQRVMETVGSEIEIDRWSKKGVGGENLNNKRFTETSNENDVVPMLIKAMRNCGYRDHRRKKRPMRAVWDEVQGYLSEVTKLQKSSLAWEAQYKRLRKPYKNYVRKTSISGREGDDPDIHELPPYYSEIHELENHATRNDPVGVISSELTSDHNIFGDKLSSTRKRKREEYVELLTDMERQTAKRHAEIVGEV